MSNEQNVVEKSVTPGLAELSSVLGRTLREAIDMRNTAMRELHAMRTVAQAHGLSTELDATQLDALTIEGGQVVGEYAYEAPGITPAGKPTGDSATTTPQTFTMDDVNAMSMDEINDNWSAIEPLLGGGGV